jgi:phage major head subunit gpT-like protein
MSNKLRENNKKVIKKVLEGNDEIKAFRDTFKHARGWDPLDGEKLPVLKEGFSLAKCAKKMGFFSLREAEQSSGWTQLLRAGVQQLVNNSYQLVETTYEDWVTVVPSTKDTELYAPIQGINFPREVPQGGLFPEVNMAGLNLKLENKKFGASFSVTQELTDDDQTGQVTKQSNLLGEYLKILTEVYVYAKLLSPTGGVTYSNLVVPVSETKPSTEANYPWTNSSAPFVGGGFNTFTAASAFSQTAIVAAYQSLMQQKNLLGLIMAVNPNRILISPKYYFDAATLLHSTYYPSGAAAAGNTGGAFAINPIHNVADLSVTRYMPDNTGVVSNQSKAWFLIDDSKPWFVHQLRTGPSIINEAPNSGQSFDRQLVRFRGDMRMNCDFIDPRFGFRGSDGSA